MADQLATPETLLPEQSSNFNNVLPNAVSRLTVPGARFAIFFTVAGLAGLCGGAMHPVKRARSHCRHTVVEATRLCDNRYATYDVMPRLYDHSARTL